MWQTCLTASNLIPLTTVPMHTVAYAHTCSLYCTTHTHTIYCTVHTHTNIRPHTLNWWWMLNISCGAEGQRVVRQMRDLQAFFPSRGRQPRNKPTDRQTASICNRRLGSFIHPLPSCYGNSTYAVLCSMQLATSISLSLTLSVLFCLFRPSPCQRSPLHCLSIVSINPLLTLFLSLSPSSHTPTTSANWRKKWTFQWIRLHLFTHSYKHTHTNVWSISWWLLSMLIHF